jgi:hypothetical protein
MRIILCIITKWEAAGKLRIVKIDETLSSILMKEQKTLKKNFGEIKKTTVGALYADQNIMNFL